MTSSQWTLLAILQLCDSSFPTGAFAFSGGVEGLVSTGLIHDEVTLRAVAEAALRESLAGVELPITRAAHQRTLTGDLNGLIALDELMGALKPVPAFRAQSVRTGRRFLASVGEMTDDPFLSERRQAIRARLAAGHHAVVFGAVLATVGADEETTTLALAATCLNGMMAAAVRLGIVGQSAAQRLIVELRPAVQEAVAASRDRALDDLGGYLPLIDLAGLAQPSLDGRLFAS